MARVYFYVVIACFYFALKSERNVQAADNLGCQSVIAGIKMNSTWTVVYSQKVITWKRKLDATTVVQPCYCNPGVGGLGNVSRIQYTNSTTGVVYSNALCLSCPGQEVAVTDFIYSMVAGGTTYTGPCEDIPVYRCSCQTPTTKSPSTTQEVTEPC